MGIICVENVQRRNKGNTDSSPEEMKFKDKYLLMILIYLTVIITVFFHNIQLISINKQFFLLHIINYFY